MNSDDNSPQYSSNFNYNGFAGSQSIKRGVVPSFLKSYRKGNIRKVQVETAEKATQRVQVNAGYENPEIICLGNPTCSGVFLRYGLTLYGTQTREGVEF